MSPFSESTLLLLKLTLGILGAATSASGSYFAQSMADGIPKSVTEYGFAGSFIFFLIACLKILWDAKKTDAIAALERERLLGERIGSLEKEMRDGLHQDLKTANDSRAELIAVLKQKSP